MLVRKHIFFYGRVQGVGFRFKAVYEARTLGLTGWVKNLPDESVEMQVQGEEQQILKLVRHLMADRIIRITDIRTDDIPLLEGEKNFRETW